MARGQRLGRKELIKMSSDINNMSKNQLQNYIRNTARIVEQDLKSEFKPVKVSSRYIVGKYGVNNRGNIKLGFSNMSKDDLLEKASQMRAHLFIDKYSKEAKEAYEEITDEMLQKAIELESDDEGELVGYEWNKEERAKFRRFMGQVYEIIRVIGSDELKRIFIETRTRSINMDDATLVHTLLDVYHRNKDKGLDHDELVFELKRAIFGW